MASSSEETSAGNENSGVANPTSDSSPSWARTEGAATQSLEEFAASAGGHEEHDSRPPSFIQVSSDTQSCASSVTTAHFQDADLFASSIYPSTQGLDEEQEENCYQSDVKVARVGALSVVEEEPTTLTSLESKIARKESRSEIGNGLSAGLAAAPSYAEHGAQAVDCQIELPELKICTKASKNATEEMKQALTVTAVTTNQRPNTKPATGVFARMMAAGITAPNNPIVQEPSQPGAYPISLIPEWPAVSSEGSTRGDNGERGGAGDTFNVNRESNLVEAQPVEAIPIAEAKECTPNEDQKFLGFNLSWHWKFVGALVLTAIIGAGTVSTVGIRILAYDPGKMREMSTKEAIQQAFGMDYFDSELKERALHWVVHEDPLVESLVKQTGEADDNWLIQRYALVAFYFQTSAIQPWTHCNPPKEPQSDVCFFFQSGERGREQRASRWLSAAHECQWMGVYCEGGSKRVSKMTIWDKNLTGPIPSELSMLSNLRFLSFADNQFSGPLPLWIDQLHLLETISLPANQFTGRIPQVFFTRPSLRHLNLRKNLLTGPLPLEMASFKKANFLHLGSNLLTGSTPPGTFSLVNLQVLFLEETLLSGTIPTTIGELPNLSQLSIGGSAFHGVLPSEIGLLSKLIAFDIARSAFAGTIPEEIYGLTALETLDLSGNEIRGTVSSRLGALTAIQTINVADNSLSGTIPIEIFKLSSLKHLRISGNTHISGSMPERFCFHKRRESKVVADCTPVASTGIPAIECPRGRCSTCCDAETKICKEK